MQFVRRHLRKGTSVWLMCHALTFTALVPRDCCAAHAHAAAPASSHGSHAAASGGVAPCHEAAAPVSGAHCEMAAADGASCPMHAPGAAPADCRIIGTCHAPEAALAAVVLQAAVLVPSFAFGPQVSPTAAPPAPDESVGSLAVPPDAPPPRL